MRAHGGGERPGSQVRVLADLAQAGAQRFPGLLDWRGHSQDGVYWLCGIAARQAASNAVTHRVTSAGSWVSS